MSEFAINVAAGKSLRLLTAGKYCDRNILVTAPDVDDGLFVKVGSMECGYNPTTLNIKSFDWWQSVKQDDIYFVPTAFSVTQTGEITGGTYYIQMSYNDGVVTAWRDSVPGKVGIAFSIDVYVYKKGSQLTGAGKIVKVAENQPLASGAGVSVDVSGVVANFADLTADDFFLDLKSLDIDATSTGGGAATVTKTYDATTGAFTFARASIPFGGSMNNYCDVYAFVPI